MTEASDSSVTRPNLTITWNGPEGRSRTALVLAAEKHTTLGALVELLVEHWDLPVWQDEPIAYDLCSLTDVEPLDLSQALNDLDLDQAARLRLVVAPGRLVMAQSPADIPILDVWHPDSQTRVSVLALSGTLNAADLQSRLEHLWSLPSFLNGELVYYELQYRGSVLLPGVLLPESGIDEENVLALVRRTGIQIISGERPEPIHPDGGLDASSAVGSAGTAVLRSQATTQAELAQREVVTPLDKQSPTKEASEKEFRKHLLRTMDEGLDTDELDELIFYLGTGDRFAGTKRARIIGLIQYYRRRNKLDELLSELCDMAPHVRDRLVRLGCTIWLP
jgi:hypothetical protein